MKKNLIKTALMGVAVATAAFAAAQQPITVTVNGQPIQFTNGQPIEEQGRVLVPLRGVFEAMGAYVHWNGANQEIDCQRGNTTVQLQIGNHQAHINDRTVNLDVPPELLNDSTMVPLRFVSEALGADVNWLDAQQTVAIRIGSEGPGQNQHFEGDRDRERQREIERQRELERQRQGQGHEQRHYLAAFRINEVIPVNLDEPLTSDRNRPGDRFTCTVNNGNGYAGLPPGTIINGHVEDVRPREGNDPGILQLDFDNIQLPNGHHIPIHGRVIGLDNNSVSRGRDGTMIANPRIVRSNNTAAWVGYGAGAGAVLGIVSHGHVITDAAIGGALGLLLNQLQRHPERARDVYLSQGTQMGVRVVQAVNVY